MNVRYFQGLHALRFFAAAIVVMFHIYINLKSFDLPQLPDWALFHYTKGKAAVNFFFTLSGFLITYLLIQEKVQTQRIQVRAFYMRRVLRIWPLYFLIVAIGLLFYFVVWPQLDPNAVSPDYRIWQAILGYGLMVPNLMYFLFTVRGILGITWSIGVEEQFYAFWAPLVKAFFHRLLLVILMTWGIVTLIQLLNAYHLLGLSDQWEGFVKTLQFNYMAIGALGAYLYHYHEKALLSWWVFKYKGIQWVLLGCLLGYFGGYRGQFPVWIFKLSLPLLYCWLILTVSVNPNRIVGLRHKWLDGLGRISYGIYMYHYLWIYLAAFMFSLKDDWGTQLGWFHGGYQLTVWGGTLLTAYISYHVFEKRFLKQKKQYQGSAQTLLSNPKSRNEDPTQDVTSKPSKVLKI